MAGMKRLCLEACRDGGFIVQDTACWSDPGNMSVIVFAGSSLDDVLAYMRRFMESPTEVKLTDAQIAELRTQHKPGDIVLVDDVPLWRR